MDSADALGKKLERRHKKFADSWFNGADGVSAYREAGFAAAEDSQARRGASRLLAREDVQCYLEALRKEELSGSAITEVDPLEAIRERMDPRHRKFADHWFSSFDIIGAVKTAGFKTRSDKDARDAAAKILSRADVEEYLSLLNARSQEEIPLTAEQLGKNLDPAHKKMADSYSVSLDRVTAFRDAGYSYSSDNAARVAACRILNRPEVQAYLDAISAEATRETVMSKEAVFRELGNIASASIDQVFSPGWELKTMSSIPEWVRGAIAKVEIVDTKYGRQKKVQMHSKGDALRMLARHYALDLNPNELISRVRDLGFDVVYRVQVPDELKDLNPADNVSA